MDLLTADEQKVVQLLADAYNAMIKLEVLHSAEQAEFSQAIHNAQRVIMSRPVQRAFNDEESEVRKHVLVSNHYATRKA